MYRAADQYGQIVDVWLSRKRDLTAARQFFSRALRCGTAPVEVTTDLAQLYPRVLDEFVPGGALHVCWPGHAGDDDTNTAPANAATDNERTIDHELRWWY